MEAGFKWLSAAVAVQEFCLKRGWPFAFIGGVAVQRWGEPRVTQDVDLTVFVGFGGEEDPIKTMLAAFPGRIPNGAAFALKYRVLLLQSVEGIPIDVALGAFPFEELVTRRATFEEYLPGIRLKVCTAEDLIVFKAFAARSRDWLDVETIITRQTGRLDWIYIRRQLRPLAELKEAPELLDQLERQRLEFEQ
jgi:hypothetical protein